MTADSDRRFDAIVFDVGGVIIDHDNHLCFRRLAARCASPGAAGLVEAAIRDPHWETGTAPVSDLHARLCRNLGYSGDRDVFLEDWTCHFTLNEEMAALVRGLAAHERVILFSNTNAEHWDYLLAHFPGALDPFERYLSHEIHLKKPAIAAFTHVAEAAGIVPGRCLFFDDRIENIEGARRAGFRAGLFVDQATLEDQLAAEGVTWRTPRAQEAARA